MKEENILKGAWQKFASARELCPGMSDDIYALTDYISFVIDDSLVPSRLAMSLALIMSDLQKGKDGFNQGKPLPEYLNQRKDQIMAQMVYFPQVVDAIADEKFANEFRQICRKVFGFNPPKRVNVEIANEYPENVRAAVDWWANAIQSTKLDNGSNVNLELMRVISNNRSGHSEKEIKIFKDRLAKNILAELQRNGYCSLYVDYNPCPLLSDAGRMIGLNSITDYPWKTLMNISGQSVEVSEGYRAPIKTIWSCENKQNKEEDSTNSLKRKR